MLVVLNGAQRSEGSLEEKKVLRYAQNDGRGDQDDFEKVLRYAQNDKMLVVLNGAQFMQPARRPERSAAK